MVALDEDGRAGAGAPRSIPGPTTSGRRAREAQVRRDNRLAERTQLDEGR